MDPEAISLAIHGRMGPSLLPQAPLRPAMPLGLCRLLGHSHPLARGRQQRFRNPSRFLHLSLLRQAPPCLVLRRGLRLSSSHLQGQHPGKRHPSPHRTAMMSLKNPGWPMSLHLSPSVSHHLLPCRGMRRLRKVRKHRHPPKRGSNSPNRRLSWLGELRLHRLGLPRRNLLPVSARDKRPHLHPFGRSRQVPRR